jgi:hypothetical protein
LLDHATRAREALLQGCKLSDTMSLGYLGRLCVRAVQAAARAEQKQPPARWFSDGRAARSAAEKKATRRAEKLMNLVCWGPN